MFVLLIFQSSLIAVVHGNWGSWGKWSSCVKNCGGIETRTRLRYCINPPPEHGGRPCEGYGYEKEQCPCKNYQPFLFFFRPHFISMCKKIVRLFLYTLCHPRYLVNTFFPSLSHKWKLDHLQPWPLAVLWVVEWLTSETGRGKLGSSYLMVGAFFVGAHC